MYTESLMKKKIGIYIHIPFCKRLCYYCHFTKFKYNIDTVNKYVQSLVKEISMKKNKNFMIDSVYLGGGSPSLLNNTNISSIINSINKSFYVQKNAEFTIEVNPEDVSGNKLRFYRGIGINRLSIGVQSFSQNDLLYLKRDHSIKQSASSIEGALDTGFTNINVDFIIGLQCQKKKTLEDNFLIIKNYKIPHISAYILEGVKAKRDAENRDKELYFFTRDYLMSLGYKHYEVSNFSKTGFASKHNLKYWNNKNYIGVGVSASGYENGRDYKNTDDLEEYIKKIEGNILPIKEVNKIVPAVRKIITGLRLLDGISITNFKFNQKELEFLLSNNLVIKNKNKIAVNPKKILLLDEILSYFI